MKFIKIKLLVIAVIMFAASSAFASLSYNVSVDTSSLNNLDGYLYFQYIPVSAANSTATVSSFVTDGTLAVDSDTSSIVNGSAVTGTLPDNVVFANTNGINDYNHAIHFGTSFNFSLLFSDPAFGGQAGGSSTFSLGLFDASLTPLLNVNDPVNAGTLFTVSLVNDGTATTQIMANEASATPTPIPAAAWLLGSGLMGLAGLRRRGKNQ